MKKYAWPGISIICNHPLLFDTVIGETTESAIEVKKNEIEIKANKTINDRDDLIDFVEWYWREVQGKPYHISSKELINIYINGL